MAAYLIANHDVIDTELLNQYLAGAGPSMAGHDIKLLVLDLASEAVEGEAGHRTVVLEFPTKDAAWAWYRSDAYQAVVGTRQAATKNGRTVIVDGFGS
jgi:uncharacterized protein (DUF1330 family)